MMTHAEYQARLARYAGNGVFFRASEIFEKELSVISETDLDAAIPFLGKLYCPIGYSQPRDPICMFRSLLLMTLFGEKGFAGWVAKTRAFPVIAVFCGFDPADTPGIGTYYDFMDRITDGPYHGRSVGDTMRQSEYESLPHRRKLGKSEPDDPAPFHSKSERLAAELLAGAEGPLSEGFGKTLGDILFAVGILPNIGDGLTDVGDMTVSGDGSVSETAASPYGKPSCDCRENGIRNCEHPRDYSSSTAEFCFDAIHDTFVFGDRYYHIVTTQGGHDFPLITIMPGGNESDYTLSLRAADLLTKLASEHCPGMSIGIFCGDGHHDSYAHFHYFDAKGIIPVIPLRKGSRDASPSLTGADVSPGTDGVPLCPGGSHSAITVTTKKRRRMFSPAPPKGTRTGAGSPSASCIRKSALSDRTVSRRAGSDRAPT